MFLIREIKIWRHNVLGDNRFLFYDKSDFTNVNYKTVLIGANGAGKSSLLYFLSDLFIALKKSQDSLEIDFANDFKCDFLIDYQFKKNAIEVKYIDKILKIKKNNRIVSLKEIELPNNLVVSTSSISERFPLKYDNRFYEFNDFNEFYQYFGVRSRRGQLARGQYIKSAFEMFIQKWIGGDTRSECAKVFEVLGYTPQINLTYINRKTMRRNPFERSDIKFNIANYLEYLSSKKSSSMMPQWLIEKINEAKIRKRLITLYSLLEDQFATENKSKKYLELRRIPIVCNLTLDNAGSRLDFLKNYAYEFNLLQKLNILELDNITLLKDQKKFNLEEASSGEIQMLSLFLSLAGTVMPDSLVLIDEPDISLHPKWQGRLIELINEILGQIKGVHYVIVTHSPFLISDLNGNEAHVLRMNKKNGIVEVSSLTQDPFGKSVEEIILDIFNLPTSRNYYLNSLVGEVFESIKEKKGILDEEDKRRLRELKLVTSQLRVDDPLLLLVNKLGDRLGV